MAPETISAKLQRLHEICEQYPDAIPIDVAAEFQGIHKDTQRKAIKDGTCPYGFALGNSGARNGVCIPTITFYLWITKGLT